MTLGETFDRIYETNGWGCSENPSGPGATMAYAKRFADQLGDFLKEERPRLFLDAGCGYYHWMARVRLPEGCDYLGVDVSPHVIDRNGALLTPRDGRTSFAVLDFVKDRLPRADVILCRYALQHLPWEMAKSAMDNFLRSAPVLLATTFKGSPPGDCAPGGMYLYDLESYLGPTERYLDESADPMYPTQRMGVWRW